MRGVLNARCPPGCRTERRVVLQKDSADSNPDSSGFMPFVLPFDESIVIDSHLVGIIPFSLPDEIEMLFNQ
jgi:hypothetical protein